MSAAPAVTLIVHTYNHERFVDECLASVDAQTFDDFDVVIVDDCSSDSTVARVEAWLAATRRDVRFLANDRNIGLCASRNLALRNARGAFLSTLSGDDFYEPDKIARQHAFFESLDPSVAAVFSDTRIVSEAGAELRSGFRPGGPPAEGRIFTRLIRGNFLKAPAVMVRRAAIEAVGAYDESLFYEDYDMWLRLADRHEFRYLPGQVMSYRKVSTSMTLSPVYRARMCESRARVLLKWFGRDPALDRVILRRARSAGLEALVHDANRGSSVLRLVSNARPTMGSRAIVGWARLPGSGRVVAALLALRRSPASERVTRRRPRRSRRGGLRLP